MESEYIEVLKVEVEKRVGRPLKCPVDFDLLSYKLNKSIHEQISISTIKRLWGYIPTSHAPRFSTLSVLARYIGFTDWDNFCSSLQQEKRNNESEFFTGKCILASELRVGDVLEIGWSPNRYCQIRYLGNNQFDVIQARNAKIKIGDTFCADQFHLNRPLIITELKQAASLNKDCEPMNYIAGYQTGLSLLSLIETD
jgi:hypothetical protein